MKFLDVSLAENHVGGQVFKIFMKLLVSCSTVHDGRSRDCLVQDWYIDLLMEGIIILMSMVRVAMIHLCIISLF